MSTAVSEGLSLVPWPAVCRRRVGEFDLRGRPWQITADAKFAGEAARFAERLAGYTGTRVSVVGQAAGRAVRFVERDHDGSDESYELSITPDEVRAFASNASGAYRATQTLLQLLHSSAADGPLVWPAVDIADRPRFRWRGVMLDTCRHLFTVDELKKHLDAMALHKLNVFHWHLTEDQAWRIEIKSHPDLAKKGGYRAGGDGVLSPSEGPLLPPGPGRYGGFYTHDDVRTLVAYAAERHITVVPEIEMPGHALAALTAYPHLACSPAAFAPVTQMGVFKDVFCAGNDAVFALLEDVLTEVCDLFPGPFIHIGGDECPKDRWIACPKCQARIRSEQLGDEHGLQSYFVRRVETFLNARGKRLVGWDEILEGGLAPNATVMSWRGTAGGIAAATAAHDVVMTPHMHLYLDYRQAATGEPSTISSPAPLTLADVYAYEPLPAELSPAQAKHVLGVQANLWTEYVPDFARAEYMLWPRACALAEIAWSPGETRNWPNFRRRITAHVRRLETLGVRYRPLDPEQSTGVTATGRGDAPGR